MELDELKRRIDDLLVEANTPEMRFNIGVFIFDVKTLEGQPFGIGCAACMMNAFKEYDKKHVIPHNTQSITHNI